MATLAAVALLASLGVLLAAPRDASAATPAAWQCRASALYASLAGQSAVEPILANGLKGSAPDATFDKPFCTSDEQGAGGTGAAIPLVDQLVTADAVTAKTSITPVTGATKDQTVTSEATTANIKLPTDGSILSIGAIQAKATAVCRNNAPEFTGSSTLTDIRLAGVPISLDDLVAALERALEPLAPIIDIDPPNQVVKTGNSIVVTPLRVKLLQAAGTPLADIVIGQVKIGASGDVCNPNSTPPVDPSDPDNQICPPGSIGQGSKPVVCVIPGTDRYGAIVIGVPNSTDTPRGGTVIPLVEARRLAGLGQLPNSKCLYGPGKDYVVVGTAGKDKIYGTKGDDRILGLGGSDRLYGVDGNDCLDGNGGNDRISGGEGNDRQYGGSGKDRLYGGGGKDKLYGESSRDVLDGGQGDDTLSGGSGNDSLFGGSGDDSISTGGGHDTVQTGSSMTRNGDRVVTHKSGYARVNIAVASPAARVTCRSSRDSVRANLAELKNLRGCKRVFVNRIVRRNGKAVGVGKRPLPKGYSY